MDFNEIVQLLKAGNNPQLIIQRLAMQNPQVGVILNQMQSSGMGAKQFAMQYAKQNNIDIQGMINFLQSQGIKL